MPGIKSTKGLVTVIIPTYNRADLVGETIQSVLDQTYKNFELFVSDDGSKDNTEEVVKNFKDSRIKYIYQPNSGFCGAPRNHAIEKSSGEYLSFLDSDDLWTPRKLELQVAAIESDDRIAVVYGRMMYFGASYKGIKYYPLKGHSGDIFEKIICGNFIPVSTVLCRRDALEKHGKFIVSKRLRGFEDYEMWVRLSKHYHFRYIDEVLCNYRVHENQFANFFIENNIKWSYGALGAFCHAADRIDISEKDLRTGLMNHYLKTAMACLDAQKFTNFELCLKNSLRYGSSNLSRAVSALNKIIGTSNLSILYRFYRHTLRQIINRSNFVQ